MPSRRHLVSTRLAVAFLAALPATLVPARAALAQKPATVTATAKAGMDPKGKRQIVCRGSRLPAGWVLVDDLRDSAQCDGTNPASIKLYNVWTIEKVEGRASGTVIDICTSSATPAGWTMVDVFRDKDRCGHPDELFAGNVKRIRKN